MRKRGEERRVELCIMLFYYYYYYIYRLLVDIYSSIQLPLALLFLNSNKYIEFNSYNNNNNKLIETRLILFY